MDKKIIIALVGIGFVLCDAECIRDYGALGDAHALAQRREIDRADTETGKHQKWKTVTKRLRTNINALRTQMGQAPVAWQGLNLNAHLDQIDVAMQLGDLITIIGNLQGDNAANTQLIADMRVFVANVVGGVRAIVDRQPLQSAKDLLNGIADDLEQNLP
ncbi:MAG: hypothetical protein LBJ96_02485 [Holosporaceae bacterium]|jgi:hypothetical protein|nr:hypothetical protein [Holosporaceae bacterium]